MSCGFILLDPLCHVGNWWDAALAWAFSWFSLNFLMGLFLGSILGARFGWLAPIAIIIAAAARFIPVGGSEPIETDMPARDAAPSPRPVRKPGERPRLRDLFRRKTRPD